MGDIPEGDTTRIVAGGPSIGVSIFTTPAACNLAADGEPIPILEYSVHFECPDETNFTGSFEHNGYVSIALKDLSLLHWNKEHIHAAIGAVANPASISCFSLYGADYITVLLTTRYKDYFDIPHNLRLKTLESSHSDTHVHRVWR